MVKQPEPKWLNPMLLKRSPLGVRVLCDLLEAAKRKGHCSANDIKTAIPKESCNTVGGVFKKLRGCGLKQTDYRGGSDKGVTTWEESIQVGGSRPGQVAACIGYARWRGR